VLQCAIAQAGREAARLHGPGSCPLALHGDVCLHVGSSRSSGPRQPGPASWLVGELPTPRPLLLLWAGKACAGEEPVHPRVLPSPCGAGKAFAGSTSAGSGVASETLSFLPGFCVLSCRLCGSLAPEQATLWSGLTAVLSN